MTCLPIIEALKQQLSWFVSYPINKKSPLGKPGNPLFLLSHLHQRELVLEFIISLAACCHSFRNGCFVLHTNYPSSSPRRAVDMHEAVFIPQFDFSVSFPAVFSSRELSVLRPFVSLLLCYCLLQSRIKGNEDQLIKSRTGLQWLLNSCTSCLAPQTCNSIEPCCLFIFDKT